MALLRGTRLAQLCRADEGSSTVEYALMVVAVAGFVGVLIVVLSSDQVAQALSDLVMRALSGDP
jgi:Flp pilus assembly pilin Flp